jgi:hypothetical protein
MAASGGISENPAGEIKAIDFSRWPLYQVQAPEFAWRETRSGAKRRRERGGALKGAKSSDFVNRQIGLIQQATRFGHTTFGDPVMNAHTFLLPDCAR